MEGDLGTKSVSAQKLVHGNLGSHIPPGKSTPHKKGVSAMDVTLVTDGTSFVY